MKEYALYSGEDFVMIGTMKEIAQAMNVKLDTAYSWAKTRAFKRADKVRNNPKAKKFKSRVAIALEDGEE